MQEYHKTPSVPKVVRHFPPATFAPGQAIPLKTLSKCALCKRFDCRNAAHHALVRHAEAHTRHEREQARGMKEAA